MSSFHDDDLTSRRTVLRACGGAAILTGGLSLLAACGDDDDAPTAGATATPTPTQSPTAPPPVPPGPTYTASDADRLNFALQVNYLLAAYLFRGVLGTTLPASLVTGSGSAGSVTGGAQVTFAAGAAADNLRELAYNTQAHITYLRRTLGNATTAQPAISIAGGAGSAFQAIASTAAFPAATPFNPYASETNYLIGLVALTGPIYTGLIDITRLLTGADLRDAMGGMLAAATMHEVLVRTELFIRARAETALFTRVNQMSDARDVLDGNRINQDEGIGDANFFNIIPANNGSALRRTPEQVLNIFFGNSAPVTAGAFFPSGINGVIRSSGSNEA